MVLHANIYFVISKEKKTPKIDLKMLKQYAGIDIFRYSCLLHRETELFN